jgi:transcriptional regulator with XRE-family HTH domain
LTISLRTIQDVQAGIQARFKTRRLEMNLTQAQLAARSGVSCSSLKRFEHLGEIALDSLLKLAMVLDCLEDFDNLAVENPTTFTLDDLLAASAREKASRKRATSCKGRHRGVFA